MDDRHLPVCRRHDESREIEFNHHAAPGTRLFPDGGGDFPPCPRSVDDRSSSPGLGAHPLPDDAVDDPHGRRAPSALHAAPFDPSPTAPPAPLLLPTIENHLDQSRLLFHASAEQLVQLAVPPVDHKKPGRPARRHSFLSASHRSAHRSPQPDRGFHPMNRQELCRVHSRRRGEGWTGVYGGGVRRILPALCNALRG